MSFLITSTGRTATLWLATIMNKSKIWTVLHEPRGFRRDNWENARDSFKNNYAEVNGALCGDIDKVDIKKALIRRDTKELVVSFSNRYEPDHLMDKIRLLKSINEFLAIQTIPVFDYHLMTTNLDYLKKIFLWAGITDYIPTKSDLNNVINQNIEPKYKKFDDLPDNFKELYYELNIPELKLTLL